MTTWDVGNSGRPHAFVKGLNSYDYFMLKKSPVICVVGSVEPSIFDGSAAYEIGRLRAEVGAVHVTAALAVLEEG